MRIVHKGLILVLVPLALAVLIIGATFAFILQSDQERLVEARQRQVSDNASNVMLGIMEMMPSVSSFDSDGRAKLKLKLKGTLDRFRAFEADLRAQGGSDVERLFGAIDLSFVEMSSKIKQITNGIRTTGATEQAGEQFREMKRSIATSIGDAVEVVHAVDGQTISLLEANHARQEQLFQIEVGMVIVGLVASLVAAILLVRWFMSGISERLQVITDNTVRLSRTEDLNPVMPGDDEIAVLDRGFHEMAAELRQAILKERALFESASDIICILDGEFRITAANPAAARAFGYSVDHTSGVSLLSLIDEDQRERTRAVLDATRSLNPSAGFEATSLRPDGSRLELLWSVYWSRMDNAFYCVAHDISERKQAELDKEQFLSMISHDLRSPLSSIYGTFRSIADGTFGPVSKPLLEKIDTMLANVYRLLALVNDILDVERLQSGKLELVKQHVIVADLLQRAVNEVEPVAAAKGIKIQVQCSALQFTLDANRIMQVLVNLLSNAIKFSPENSIVQLVVVAQPELLRVQVIDRGRGVPDGLQATIFERFKQVSSADGKSGTGLGLPICKLIVEQHGGKIGVDSGEGKGSNFWFEIPIKPKGSTGAPAVAPNVVAPAVKADPVYTKLRKRDAANAQPGWRLSFTNLPLLHKGFVLVLIPLVFELIFCGLLLTVLFQAHEAKQQEHHQALIAITTTDLMMTHSAWSIAMDLEQWQASYDAYKKFAKDGFSELRRLDALVEDDAALKPAVAKFHEVYVPLRSFMDRVEATIKSKGANEQALAEAFSADNGCADFGPKLVAAGENLLDQSDELHGDGAERLQELRTQQGLVLLGGLAISIALSAVSALLFANGIARRLAVTEDNVRKLKSEKDLNEPLSGNDEVAHLDQYLHSMAAALHEARYKERAVFNNAQDAICAIDLEGNILRTNPACGSLWGYDKAELVGRSIYTLMQQSSLAAFADGLVRVNTQREAVEFETRVLRSNGEPRDVLWSLSWSQPEAAAIAIAHDITAGKELDRLKHEFLSMVSHDMRTPLSAILMTTEMIVAGVLGEVPDRCKQQLAIVGRGCERLLSLINDLLDIDKLQSGQMQLQRQTVPAVLLLQRASEALAMMARAKNIGVVIDAPGDLTVDADSDRIVQVGINLLSNAIKFSANSSTVWLKASKRSGFVQFEISDVGCGIAESDLQMLFERYQQTSERQARAGAGAGLGLPICKQIVEKHGGTIGVASQPGKGSTFWFRLPLSAADAMSAVTSGAAEGGGT